MMGMKRVLCGVVAVGMLAGCASEQGALEQVLEGESGSAEVRLKAVYPSASGVFTVCTADAQRVRDVFGSDVVDTLGDDVNAIVYQRNDNMILSETYDRAHIDLCLGDHTKIRDVTGEVLSFVQDGDKWALHGLEGVPVEDEIGDPVN